MKSHNRHLKRTVLSNHAIRIGLCVTNNLAAFTAISCIVSITTVTPQLMLPLVGDLAPPHRRASAMSIVVSGFMLGILVARVLSGTLTNFTSWRAIYWFAFGMQTLILALLWLFMPDYPSANPAGLNYFRMLYSILQMLVRHAVLVQACLVSFFTSCTFTSFWTTLTFLLAGAPYHYSSLVIGLFALIGIAAMLCAPLYARLVIDRFVPLFSVIVCESVILLGICLGTYLGSFTVAGPILQAFLLDFGLQGAQTANRSNIYSVEPRGRNRVNTAFMVATFGGQLTGTAVGNHVYARAGWIGSGSASVGFIGAGLLCCAARGPWETRWVGWRGGWSIIKKDKKTADGKVVVAAGEKQDENWKGEERKDEELPPPPSPPAYDEKAVVEETNAREVDARDGSEKAVDAGLRSAEDSRLQSTESLEIKTAEKSQEELDDGKRGRA
ncbi:major facilitator superfamily domain-containing protein [Lineolata rhizophorae]|uniref:Major facilitator superfamily domain-containing protein n=1 Tax=Lineolata rhizophorae TaxID=578093 RepID=A0A6A6P262_9PEZI|nr:major facilitator superfamily domain-containing protein [Lineolata rhizophorae]